jgi:ABC-type glycerol-3-phosphate transport system substrate-binding protein
LPVHKSLLDDPLFKQDPQMAAFLATLPNANPLFWVDEKGERQAVIDMADKVLLNNEDPKTVFEWGTKQEQAIRDEFFNN